MAKSQGRSALLLLVFVAQTWLLIESFQSDELVDEDEEWGLVGLGRVKDNLIPNPASNGAAKRPGSVIQGDALPNDGKVEFPLEHAFGNSEFTVAGTFTARLRPSSRGGQTLVKLRLSRRPFTTVEKELFDELVNEDGFYSIRVPANVLNLTNTFVQSSTRARCLSAAGFQERFNIFTDQAKILAIGYGAAGECPYPRAIKHPKDWTFNSYIVSKGGEQASRLSVVKELLDVGMNEKIGDDDVPVQPERSFWAKYWMYIIPLGLIIVNAINQVANLQEDPASAQGTQPGAQRIANPVAGRRR